MLMLDKAWREYPRASYKAFFHRLWLDWADSAVALFANNITLKPILALIDRMSNTELYQKLEETALGHKQGYESPHPWSFEHIWRYRTEDCVHYLYPNTRLPAPFNEGLKKDGFEAAMHFFGSVMDATRFEMHNICVDTIRRTVMLHVTGHMDLKAAPGFEAEVDWQVQYMWLCHMEESGEKIFRVDEFMDGERLMEQVKARAENMMASQTQQ